MARPRRGTLVLRASAVGAATRAQDFDRAQRALQDELVRTLRNLAVRGVAVLGGEITAAGRVDSGDLLASVRARLFFRAARPQVTFEAPSTHDGYPYAAVSRFGHRKAVIQGRPLLAIKAPGRASTAQLVPSVRGFGFGEQRPVDWVRLAEPVLARDSDVELARLGRRIETSALPGRLR